MKPIPPSELKEALEHHSDDRVFEIDPSDKDKGTVFMIHTVIRTYLFRAKHEVAMNEWIAALQPNSESNNSIASPTYLTIVLFSLILLVKRIFLVIQLIYQWIL
jgi:hypothetical protein